MKKSLRKSCRFTESPIRLSQEEKPIKSSFYLQSTEIPNPKMLAFNLTADTTKESGKVIDMPNLENVTREAHVKNL